MPSRSYWELSAAEKKETFETVRDKTNLGLSALEKDIWVCWTLGALFSMPGAYPMVFRGGTSLSKVYRLTQRFSEDVDITLDYRNFGADIADEQLGSDTKRLRKYIRNQIKTYCRDQVIPYLQAQLALLPNTDGCKIKLDAKNPVVVLVDYEPVIEDRGGIVSKVQLEFFGRSVLEPNNTYSVATELASFNSVIELPQAEGVITLAPERTFWEKAILLHRECRRNFSSGVERLSRHWYDLAELAKSEYGESALEDKPLLLDVIEVRNKLFPDDYSRFEDCASGKLLLVPQQEYLPAIEGDYQNMIATGMFYEDPPAFDSIVRELTALQQKINAMNSDSEK